MSFNLETFISGLVLLGVFALVGWYRRRRRDQEPHDGDRSNLNGDEA